MNREIKFRAWLGFQRGGGEMVYEKYAKNAVGKSMTSAEILSRYGDVMQFTGLLDKSGKEIYEGDIVKYSGINFEVKWEFEDMGWSIANNSSELEVIGNIYENKELLIK